MSVELSSGWSNAEVTSRGFLRSALLLIGWFAATAVPLGLVAIVNGQSGSGGPWGIAAAAAICLVAGLVADGVAGLAHRAHSPLGALLAGMALRMFPPLAVCLVLATRGGGREHLAFVFYLLAFYLVTLALETYWAVRRTSTHIHSQLS